MRLVYQSRHHVQELMRNLMFQVIAVELGKVFRIFCEIPRDLFNA